MYSNIYNIKETSSMLGISISMLRKLIYQNKIKYLKIGNRYYIRECDLDEFINSRVGGEEI